MSCESENYFLIFLHKNAFKAVTRHPPHHFHVLQCLPAYFPGVLFIPYPILQQRTVSFVWRSDSNDDTSKNTFWLLPFLLCLDQKYCTSKIHILEKPLTHRTHSPCLLGCKSHRNCSLFVGGCKSHRDCSGNEYCDDRGHYVGCSVCPKNADAIDSECPVCHSRGQCDYTAQLFSQVVRAISDFFNDYLNQFFGGFVKWLILQWSAVSSTASVKLLYFYGLLKGAFVVKERVSICCFIGSYCSTEIFYYICFRKIGRNVFEYVVKVVECSPNCDVHFSRIFFGFWSRHLQKKNIKKMQSCRTRAQRWVEIDGFWIDWNRCMSCDPVLQIAIVQQRSSTKTTLTTLMVRMASAREGTR